MELIKSLHSIRQAIVIDLASSQKKQKKSSDPDYTVIMRGGMQYRGNIGKLFVLDVQRFREKAVKRNKRIIEYLHEYSAPAYAEAFGAYKDTYEILKDTLMGVRTVLPLNLPGDKEMKADPLRPLFEAGNIYMVKAPWNSDFIDECAVFPNGIHDDMVDCVAMLYHIFKKKPRVHSKNIIY